MEITVKKWFSYFLLTMHKLGILCVSNKHLWSFLFKSNAGVLKLWDLPHNKSQTYIWWVNTSISISIHLRSWNEKDEVTWLSSWCIRQQCRGTGCNQWRHCTEDLYRVSSRTSDQGKPDRPSASPVQQPDKKPMVNCVSHLHSKIVQKWHSLTFNHCICNNHFTCVALSSVSSRLFSHTLGPCFPFFMSWTCTRK